MMSHPRRALLALSLSLALTGFAVAQDAKITPPQEKPKDPLAQEVEKVVGSLDPIILSATKHEARLFDTPFHADVVEPLEIARARTVQDALQQTPGVQIQRTSYGQISPFLRGFTGYHTVMMVDGIRLNNSVVRSGPNEYWGLVDGLSLDRIEAVFGPGSVLYGSDAIGGAVNAITRRRKSYGPESSWDRRVVLRYSSAEESIIGRAEVSGNVGENFGYVIGGTGGAFSDLRSGGGDQPDTNYHNAYGDAHLDYRLDEHWSIGLLAQVGYLQNVNRVHRTVNAVPFAGITPGSDASRDYDWERNLVAFFIDGEDLETGFADTARVRLSWQRIEEAYRRHRTDGRRSFSEFDVNTFGIAIELAKDTSIGRITYGVDYYHDEVDSTRTDYSAAGVATRRIQGSVGDDASYDLLGVFVQDEVAIHDDVDLILGARFTYAAADVGRYEDPVSGGVASLDDSWLNAVGSLRVVWHATEDLNVFGGVSQGFRAPNLSDLSRFDISRGGELEVPSPDLDPEHFITFEIGMKWRWEGLRANLVYHYTILDDLIIRQPTGASIGGDLVVLKRNAGDGHRQGIELSLHYDFDAQWFAWGSLQWNDGQADTYPTSAPVAVEEALSRIPPLVGFVGAGWRTEDRKFEARAWAHLSDRQDRFNTRDSRDNRFPPNGTPGFVTLNVDASYRITEKAVVHASVLNLLDKNYRLHGSGVQEAGVNAVIGVDITF